MAYPNLNHYAKFMWTTFIMIYLWLSFAILKLSVCVPQKKESHMGLEQHVNIPFKLFNHVCRVTAHSLVPRKIWLPFPVRLWYIRTLPLSLGSLRWAAGFCMSIPDPLRAWVFTHINTLAPSSGSYLKRSQDRSSCRSSFVFILIYLQLIYSLILLLIKLS